ncbi:MAG: hypothetical protein K0Q48_2390 [Bacillota bacterium]|jgi:hypothetical protein|nr:hypothetical protein [Bacillota bacterium]
MRNIILACEILEDEIRKARSAAENQDPIIWIDSSLHMFPQKLHDKLQEEIDRIDREQAPENILLSFGYCGNSVVGLKSSTANLIFPQANDCIDLFLYKNKDKITIRSSGCYFLTRGWLKSQYSIVNEYDRYLERYGQKKTDRIMDVMLAHYKCFTLLDTGAYPVEDCTPIALESARKLNMQLCMKQGSIQHLIKLFSEDWDEDFCIVPPGSQVTLDHFSELSLSPAQGQIL